MTLKSLITVDVDDSAFDAFQKKFAAFQKMSQVSLGVSPSGDTTPAPSPVDRRPSRSLEHDMSEAVEVLEQIRDLVRKVFERQKEGSNGSLRSELLGESGGMGGSPLGFLRGGLGKLALGAAVTTAVAGLVYEGGKFILNGAGMRGTAENFVSLQREARAANVRPGAYRAFQIGLEPYGDGGQLLQQVAEAQSNIGSLGYAGLHQLGVSSGATADKGALAVVDKLRDIYLQTRNNPELLQSAIASANLTPFDPSGAFSRQLGSMSDADLAKLHSQLADDTKKFDIADNNAKVWQDLNTALAESRASIDTVFLRTLPGAAKAETEAVARLTGTLVSAADAIQKAFPGLTSGVGENSTIPNMLGLSPEASTVLNSLKSPQSGLKVLDDARQYAVYKAAESWDVNTVLKPGEKSGPYANTALTPALAPFEFSNIAAGLGQTESGGNSKAVNAKSGARGLFQISPILAKDYGYSPDDMMDPRRNAAVASDYWNKMLAKYNDPLKAAAAYNEGPGRLDAQLAKYGDQWIEHLKDIPGQETYKYVTSSPLAKRVNEIRTGGTPLSPSPRIQIIDNTSVGVNAQARLSVR